MSEPPPSYEEAQGMTTGPPQPPYPPQDQYYQGPKVDGYSGNPPYPTQPGPYPPQQGYPQQSYTYQPAAPPQGNYPPGTYVHPTVGYSPAQGVVVQNQGPVTVGGVGYGFPSAQAQNRKGIVICVVFSTMVAVIVLIIMITVMS